jgi:WD40 repeat protein/serine/threonine protein kinase
VHPSGDSEAADVFDFVDEFLGDRERGEVRTLAHYLARYPRAQDAVAREYLALCAPDAEERPSNGAAPDDERRIGPYRVLAEIGRGGQGAVLLAEDTRIARKVALKVLASRFDLVSEDRRRRFRREAEVIARLDHPGICGIYDADIDGDAPYIAMRFVAGKTLAQLLAEAKKGTADASSAWPPRSALEIRRVLHLFERVARALHAAHEAGVVHRDVKPGNVMIADDGSPVLLDFGLARDAQGDLEQLTQSGDVFGTPAYMSPEQLSGEGILDRRTDVYALAVSLHEALTLARPIEGSNRLQLLQKMRDERVPDARKRNPQVSHELQVVLETALEVDRDRRYPTALEFAEDLRRIREYEPIRARPAGVLLRFSRWVQRHPALAVSIIGTIASLAGGLALTLHLLGKTDAALQRADGALQVALGHHLAQRCLDLIPEDPALALALGIEAADLEIRQTGSEQGADYATRSAIFEALDACWLEQVVLSEPARFVTDVAASPDGRLLALATDEGFARVFDLETRTCLVQVGGFRGRIARVFFTPDGARLVLAANDGGVGLFDAATGALLRRVDADGPLVAADLAADGERILTLGCAGEVDVFDLASGERSLAIDPGIGVVESASFRPRDGAWILTGSSTRGVGVWDAGTGRPICALGPFESPVALCALDPASPRAAIATADGGVRVVDLPGGSPAKVLAHVGEKPGFLAFSPDGRRLLLATDRDEEGSVFLIDAGNGACRPLLGHQGRRVLSAAFDRDGARVATASFDATLRIWDAATGAELAVRALPRDRPIAALWTPDGKRLVTPSVGRIVDVWFAGNRPDMFHLVGHTGAVVRARFSPDDRTALTASADGTARLWSIPPRLGCAAHEPGTLLGVLAHDGPVTDARFDAGGEEVLTASSDGTARRWSARTGRLLSAPLVHPSSVLSAEADASGDRILTVCADGKARLFDAHSTSPALVLAGGPASIRSACFSPDGSLVAGGGEPEEIGIWEATTGKLLRSIRYARYKDAPEGAVVALAFRPDGDEIAAACADSRVRFRNPRNGALARADAIVFPPRRLEYGAEGSELLVLGRYGGGAAKVVFAGTARSQAAVYHVASVTGGALSADGSLVLTFARDGSVHVWKAKTGEPVAHRSVARGAVLDGSFDGDLHSPRVITACEDGSVSVWPVDPLPAARARRPRTLYANEKDRERQLAKPLDYD